MQSDRLITVTQLTDQSLPGGHFSKTLAQVDTCLIDERARSWFQTGLGPWCALLGLSGWEDDNVLTFVYCWQLGSPQCLHVSWPSEPAKRLTVKYARGAVTSVISSTCLERWENMRFEAQLLCVVPGFVFMVISSFGISDVLVLPRGYVLTWVCLFVGCQQNCTEKKQTPNRFQGGWVVAQNRHHYLLTCIRIEGWIQEGVLTFCNIVTWSPSILSKCSSVARIYDWVEKGAFGPLWRHMLYWSANQVSVCFSLQVSVTYCMHVEEFRIFWQETRCWYRKHSGLCLWSVCTSKWYWQ